MGFLGKELTNNSIHRRERRLIKDATTDSLILRKRELICKLCLCTECTPGGTIFVAPLVGWVTVPWLEALGILSTFCFALLFCPFWFLTFTDQVSIWKSSRGLIDKVILDHDCSGETCTYYQIGDVFVCEKTRQVHEKLFWTLQMSFWFVQYLDIVLIDCCHQLKWNQTL
ncbi:F-box protein SKIP31 [Camellia lanceoleosa]|uniref:F-box protein SKIP31 n=1 Tax=Camellia lanceoleosa TaxID=1840588 RepID=A0ACC0H610_9ERIC|nr:F-box protein SKIP31 [Camellia lanceoleosa]